MPQAPRSASSTPSYIIKRSRKDDSYSVWKLDPTSPDLVTRMKTDPRATFPAGDDLCAVGGYMLAYSLAGLNEATPVVPYRMFSFDPSSSDPLNAPAIHAGKWPKMKFWQYFDHYTWNPKETDIVQLVPMTGYVMTYMPTAARGTYQLWNFDPAPNAASGIDPLPQEITPQDSFSLIGEGSQLLPVGNYVLEWISASSSYRVWSFDPQEMRPLELPAISEGRRPDIKPDDRLLVIGGDILQWEPATRAYRLWRFDPFEADPFAEMLRKGVLPEGFGGDSDLTAVQTLVPVDAAAAEVPGTMDFMRDKIEHVVVYMLESRTMDSVLGWLYADDPQKPNFVDAAPPFKGTSKDHYNEAKGRKYHVYQYEDGKLSEDFVLAAPAIDPFHGTPDSIRQLYSGGYKAYFAGETPDMGGFVSSNVSGEVMVTFSPTQLPVLNGLAGAFAVSDEWFSSLPGLTSSNRAFALTGSGFNVVTNCEGDPQYSDWHPPAVARRQSVWKVLSNNGIDDWKIYWAVKWDKAVFTYQLFLKGMVPSVDDNVENYVSPIETFFADAKAGMLPKFSFLEPAWIAPTGATSYHPGETGDMVPGEVQLNKIYEAIASGPGWDKTALVITFSKGGGMYDHVPPPPTINPWPKDENDGFTYNVLGPRVPTIVVSPWVNENTVFRSPGETPFSATSLLATILEWFGVPSARWGLGDRVQASETFSNVFQRTAPRTDKPAFEPPYDKTYPRGGRSKS